MQCVLFKRTMSIINRVKCGVSLLRLRRNIFTNSLCRHKAAYNYDGKTKVNIFNTQPELGIMITGYSQYGFRLNNNMVVIGPMVVFPKTILSWNVNTMEDINEQSLSLFTALDPKIDVLIIGIGDQTPSPNFSKKILDFMKKYKINVEVLRTEQACSTFNFLNAENRMVASALIPPLHLEFNENDVLHTKRDSLAKSLYIEKDEL